ncbi:inactive serine protease PAMR1 [Clarias gariepinus]|uniref:inactive serine protease PAMR1 n=1 Tax=Clarias gariepinus TaxID=13013 RepID=UPI00234D2E80|nr:inactive serine protease PAMR1 [Clarias gariepinus]
MPSAARLQRQSQRQSCMLLHTSLLFILLLIFLLISSGMTWPHDYRYLYNFCPGPEWNVMCRACCEYDVIRCKCPVQGTQVGYAVPCCRNARHECDPCIIHPGCSIFENCKRCNNGTWGPRDDFFIKGQYCAECRPGWSGGDCMKCGGVIRKRQGHLVLESYPTNARCEWILQVNQPFTVELRFMMLSLEFDHSCRYDYVEVRDGDSINSQVIGRFCGNERPPPIHSTGNSLHILFVSDGYKNFDGLFAIFQENSACTSSPCLHDGTCILDTSHSFHCACLAGYTGKRCEYVLECKRPMAPDHGAVSSLDVRVGGQAVFVCDPGFTLKGFHMATCLLDGSWSRSIPYCVPEKNCGIPPKPSHGDHFLVYGPNDVLIALQYLCYRPYTLFGNPQRTCLGNNTWSGTAPTCVKEGIIPVPDNEKDILKGSDIGKDKQTDFTDKSEVEKEKTPDKTVSLEIPISGKDKIGLDTDINKSQEVEKGKDFVKEKPTVGRKDKIIGKESEDIMNTVRKKDSDNGKIVHYLDKDGDLDSAEKVVIDTTNELDTNIVDVVLIDDKSTNKETSIHKATEKDNKETATEIPLYTIVSLRKDEKDVNIPYKIDFSSTTNTTESVDSNDIEENLQTLLPKETPKIQPEAHTDNSTESAIVPTQYPTTESVTAGESQQGVPQGKKTVPDSESSVKEKTDMSTRDEMENQHAEKAVENLSIIEAEGRKCPPPPRLYHGFYEWLPGTDPEIVEFSCNHSYALSGAARRICQPNGTWSDSQPICVRACREPKVSVLVRQKVLPPHVSFRQTPVHKFYSASGLAKLFTPVSPTKGPPSLPPLSEGFHHLYTHIEYGCTSPYYHHSGSTRRTCLKTGKWSGRHVSCSPVCGKLPNFDPQNPAATHWPWLVAIYRRSAQDSGEKLGKATSPGKDMDLMYEEDDMSLENWQLVCSGALLNQRSVVVAAHCVTDLGKVYPLDVSKIRVVLGKHYRSDLRQTKSLQHLRVSSITVHPNYDPLVLDSDLAFLKLLDKARIGEHILPICLPTAHDAEIEALPRGAIVTGWSLTPDASVGESERARVGTVTLGDVVHCEQQYAQYGLPISVSENMLCGRLGPGVSPSNICPAETGGVLIAPPTSSHDLASSLLPNPTQEWKLLGLVSFGYDSLDCNPELYTVYTHISNFLDFFESNMK